MERLRSIPSRVIYHGDAGFLQSQAKMRSTSQHQRARRQGCNHLPSPGPFCHVGRVDQRRDQEPERVDHHVALAPCDLLGRVAAASPPIFRRLDALAIEDGYRGKGSAVMLGGALLRAVPRAALPRRRSFASLGSRLPRYSKGAGRAAWLATGSRS